MSRPQPPVPGECASQSSRYRDSMAASRMDSPRACGHHPATLGRCSRRLDTPDALHKIPGRPSRQTARPQRCCCHRRLPPPAVPLPPAAACLLARRCLLPPICTAAGSKVDFNALKAPAGYVAGMGRGAAGFTTRSDIGPSMPAPKAGGDNKVRLSQELHVEQGLQLWCTQAGGEAFKTPRFAGCIQQAAMPLLRRATRPPSTPTHLACPFTSPHSAHTRMMVAPTRRNSTRSWETMRACWVPPAPTTTRIGRQTTPGMPWRTEWTSAERWALCCFNVSGTGLGQGGCLRKKMPWRTAFTGVQWNTCYRFFCSWGMHILA